MGGRAKKIHIFYIICIRNVNKCKKIICVGEREGGNNSLEKKEKKFPVTRILFNNVNKIRMRKICQKVIRNKE